MYKRQDKSVGISLGTYEPSEQGEFIIKINLPAESDNQFNIQQANTNLIVSSSAIEPAANTGYRDFEHYLLFVPVSYTHLNNLYTNIAAIKNKFEKLIKFIIEEQSVECATAVSYTHLLPSPLGASPFF